MFARRAGDCAGIIIPYVSPGENRPDEYRLRLDNPEMEQRSDGTLHETRKYIQPPGRPNRIYFPPGLSPVAMTSASLPLIITEGEFKALALWRLANHDVTQPALRASLRGRRVQLAWNDRQDTGPERGTARYQGRYPRHGANRR